MEFKIGDTVTLDRYNHIDDIEKVKIIDIQPSWTNNDSMDYIMDVRGVKIRSSGRSIMESKDYDPVPDEERHYRTKATLQEKEDYWDRLFGRFKK